MHDLAKALIQKEASYSLIKSAKNFSQRKTFKEEFKCDRLVYVGYVVLVYATKMLLFFSQTRNSFYFCIKQAKFKISHSSIIISFVMNVFEIHFAVIKYLYVIMYVFFLSSFL